MSQNKKENNIKEGEHLSLYGVGPFYGFIIILITLIAIFNRNFSFLSYGKISFLQIPLLIIGTLLILLSIYIWIQAVIIAKVDKGIKNNKLVTTGIYGWVRHPIYSAITMLCTGILFISGNVFFFVLPFLYWLIFSILVKNTEEKWLRELYGKEYDDYCRQVNRCIPWKSKLNNVKKEIIKNE